MIEIIEALPQAQTFATPPHHNRVARHRRFAAPVPAPAAPITIPTDPVPSTAPADISRDTAANSGRDSQSDEQQLAETASAVSTVPPAAPARLTAEDENRFVNDLMPALMANANAWARRRRLYGDVREDMVAEIVALAWEQYRQGLRRGREPHAGHLWWVASRRYRSGMPFAGRRVSRDVCSRYVMKETGHELIYLDQLEDPKKDADEVLAMASSRGRMPNPMTHALMRVEIGLFKRLLSGVEPEVFDLRVAGYNPHEISKVLRRSSRGIYDVVERVRQAAAGYFLAPTQMA